MPKAAGFFVIIKARRKSTENRYSVLKTFLSCVALLGWATAALAQPVPADNAALDADRTAKREQSAQAAILSARRAVAREDWQAALREWQALYVAGNAEAAGQLCRLYFDARQGNFDVKLTTLRCRDGAGTGDAGALYRLALLYLAGVGVDWNIDQARALCVGAQNAGNDPDIAPGFCLAFVTQEEKKASHAALRAMPSPPSAAIPATLAALSLPQQCETLFAGRTVPFDPAETIRACTAAANAGDYHALYRLGLINLLGVGVPRDLARAQTDCAKAEAQSAGHLSAAFCLAAVDRLRRDAQTLAAGQASGNIDTNPVTGLPLPKTEVDPYLADRLLDQKRRTNTGLEYTCRQLREWAEFEAPGLIILTPRDKLFGRKIVDYRPADFAALREAAAGCIKIVADVDLDGSVRQDLVTFRNSLGALETRRVALRASSAAHAELASPAIDAAALRVEVVAPGSVVTPQENACFDDLKRTWAARNPSGKTHTALEIAQSKLAIENGSYVVRGLVSVVEDRAGRQVRQRNAFTCSFTGDTDQLATSVVLSEAPNRQSAGGAR